MIWRGIPATINNYLFMASPLRTYRYLYETSSGLIIREAPFWNVLFPYGLRSQGKGHATKSDEFSDFL